MCVFLHLRYVAHSMGMTALFVMLHNEPYRNSQLSRVTALAPVTGIAHPTGIIANFLPTALGVIQGPYSTVKLKSGNCYYNMTHQFIQMVLVR